MLPSLTNSKSRSRKEPHVFGPLEPSRLRKNTRSRLDKKSRAGVPLEKKNRCRSRKEIIRLPSPASFWFLFIAGGVQNSLKSKGFTWSQIKTSNTTWNWNIKIWVLCHYKAYNKCNVQVVSLCSLFKVQVKHFDFSKFSTSIWCDVPLISQIVLFLMFSK